MTAAQFVDLQFFAGYAAAAYCNSANAPGEAITCANDGCTQAEADGAVTVASFT